MSEKECGGYTQTFIDVLNSRIGQDIANAFEMGAKHEQERIIKLLKANIMWIEALEYDYWADELADLITGKDPGRQDDDNE